MNIREFVSCLNKREMIERKSMTEQEVIDAVKLNKFFGFVECDIEVVQLIAMTNSLKVLRNFTIMSSTNREICKQDFRLNLAVIIRL